MIHTEVTERHGFTDIQLKKIAYFVETHSDEEIEIFLANLDKRIEAFLRVQHLINEHTHPKFRFGNAR